MTTAKKLLYFTLLIITLSSKQIIIYNEEILVASCFIIFIILIRKSFGKTFQGILDGRLQAIREELQQFLTPNEELLLKAKEEEAHFRTSLLVCVTIIESLPGSCFRPNCEKTVLTLLTRCLQNQFLSLQGALSLSHTHVKENLIGAFELSVRESFSTATKDKLLPGC
uniref:ATP synthase protein MI25 n=1 Tax=Pelargonium citronellum TaxID=73188 RepID=A0A1J0PJT3_9ROSI|nr:ATP synthase subunit 4 [Pelargonium citronellum]